MEVVLDLLQSPHLSLLLLSLCERRWFGVCFAINMIEGTAWWGLLLAWLSQGHSYCISPLSPPQPIQDGSRSYMNHVCRDPSGRMNGTLNLYVLGKISDQGLQFCSVPNNCMCLMENSQRWNKIQLPCKFW